MTKLENFQNNVTQNENVTEYVLFVYIFYK